MCILKKVDLNLSECQGILGSSALVSSASSESGKHAAVPHVCRLARLLQHEWSRLFTGGGREARGRASQPETPEIKNRKNRRRRRVELVLS
jgi:hypothetical protein